MVNGTAKNTKKADTLKALLSLSATEKKVTTRCLSAQEMAELIDARSDHDSYSKFQDHLSKCDRCYQEWLFLKKIHKPKTKHGGIYPLSGAKKRKLTGAALAIAASIAVFVNIPRHQDTIFEQSAPVEDITPQSTDQYPPHLQETKEEKENMLFPSDAENTLQEHQVRENEEIDQQLLPESNERFSKPVLRVRKKTMASGSVATPAPSNKERSNLDHWLTELQIHCQSAPKKPPSFWFSVRTQGKQLLKNQSPTISDEKRRKVLLLLELLTQIDDEDSAISQCQRIRSELAEDE